MPETPAVGNAAPRGVVRPPSSARLPMASPSSRSLAEIALGFVGAILIVPLLFKSVGLVFRVLFGTVKGVFKLGVTRRLAGDLVVAGLTAMLTKESVLDTLFGKKGQIGDGALKPDAKK